MPKKKTYGFGSKKTAEDVIALVGGGDQTYVEGRSRGFGNRLFRFTLTATLSGTTANATIKDMSGSTVATTTVSDPESIFTGLASGKSGLCYLQGGVYYIIQAKC